MKDKIQGHVAGLAFEGEYAGYSAEVVFEKCECGSYTTVLKVTKGEETKTFNLTHDPVSEQEAEELIELLTPEQIVNAFEHEDDGEAPKVRVVVIGVVSNRGIKDGFEAALSGLPDEILDFLMEDEDVPEELREMLKKRRSEKPVRKTDD